MKIIGLEKKPPSTAQKELNDAATAALLRAAREVEAEAEADGREIVGVTEIAARTGRSEYTLRRVIRGDNWPSDLIARVATATAQHPVAMLAREINEKDRANGA